MEKFDSQHDERLQERQRMWDEKMEALKRPDIYGYVIDPGVVEAVAALQLSGINTTQSDQGNYSYTPWIEVGANMPDDIYMGEKELKEEIMKQNGIHPGEINQESPLFDRSKQVDVEDEAQDALANSNADYTAEFLKWQEDTQRQVKNLQNKIDEFYRSNPTPSGYEDLRISIEYVYQSNKYAKHIREVPSLRVKVLDDKGIEKEGREQLANRTRAEMQRFSAFLKQSFLNSAD